MKKTSVNDIAVNDSAVYLQRRLGRYHPLDEIVTVLEESLSRFRSIESLRDYIVGHESGLYLSLKDGIDIIL